MTQCWIDSCCYRKNMCEKYLIDINKIIDAQNSHNDPYVKANMIISNTSYAKLAQIMNGGNHVISYNICDFLDEEATLTINKGSTRSTQGAAFASPVQRSAGADPPPDIPSAHQCPPWSHC